MWNSQSYPTTVLNEKCDILGGQNMLWPLLHIFGGSIIPNPRIYAPHCRGCFSRPVHTYGPVGRPSRFFVFSVGKSVRQKILSAVTKIRPTRRWVHVIRRILIDIVGPFHSSPFHDDSKHGHETRMRLQRVILSITGFLGTLVDAAQSIESGKLQLNLIF